MSHDDERTGPDPVHDGADAAFADAAFAARVAAPLRAPEAMSVDFEARVMHAVRETAARGEVTWLPARRESARDRAIRAWWRRPRPITPVAALAAALVFGAVVSLGTIATVRAVDARGGAPAVAAQREGDGGMPVTAANRDARVVRFVLVAHHARSVALVGDFNGWARHATLLRPQGDGIWAVSVPLPPGRYQYAFILDGRRWRVDPDAPTIADDFGTRSSVLTLGASCTGAGAPDRVT